MNKAKVVLLGAAGATLLVWQTVGSSDTAEAVMVCRARMAGEGIGRGVADQRTTNARATALSDWSRRVETRLGKQFANPSLARDVRFDCRPGVLQAKCAVSAVPCADIPRATKGKAKKKKAKKKRR